MSNINLTKAELTEYLESIEKTEEFKEWLTKKRNETQTLDSLLDAPATGTAGKGTRMGGKREEVDYGKVYGVIGAAGADGLTLKAICEKAGYDYRLGNGKQQQVGFLSDRGTESEWLDFETIHKIEDQS